jgi:thiamine biosynthesis protein ThiS
MPRQHWARWPRSWPVRLYTRIRRVLITLNGERFELDRPLSVTDLLERLAIDPRRVAVEHNLRILKRQAFPDIIVHEGDQVEIVNFVGGG